MIEAAPSVPNISREFKKTPLAEVIQKLEKKSKYTIVYDASEVDGNKLITAKFEQTKLTSAVKRVFGKQFDVKANTKAKTITVTKKPSPAPKQTDAQVSASTEAAESVPTSPTINDSIRQNVRLETTTRIDSTMKVTTRKVKQLAEKQPEPKYAHCSHRMIVGAGVGYGEVIKHGSVAALADVSYAFFFSDNWGVSIGLGVDYYQSRYLFSQDYVINQYIDTDTEPQADLHINDRNMVQQHNLLTINTPIQMQMEYPLPSTRTPLWLYGCIGPRIGYPVVHTEHLRGERYQYAYYAKWDLTLENMHEYGSSPIDQKSDFPVKIPTIAPHAELGVAIGVGNDISLRLGAYGNVSVLNETGYQPWQVGAKVGIEWRKNVKPQPMPNVYETITVKDTAWTYREIVDTIRIVEYDTIHPAAKQIAHIMETSIIWFDLDKTTPKLDPPDMLDRIAEILLANPNQRIEINGHTCDLGSKTYNENLSLRRAKAVVELLIKKGVRPGQMEIHAYANSKPYYSKVHDRILDRRVEIVPIVDETK